MSISSRQTGVGSERILADRSPHLISSASRSNASIRKLATPPSSFPSRVIGSESARNLGYVPDPFDEEHPQSTAEIRQEILVVEAESRRVMDAFNGLEMTMLTKVRRHQHQSLLQDGIKHAGSSSSMFHDGQSPKRVVIVDTDMDSVRSGTSSGSPSMLRSQPGRKTRVGLNGSVSLGSPVKGPLPRKNSTTSLGSQERKGGGQLSIPPVPTLPSTYGHLVGSVSNISLARSIGLPDDVRSAVEMRVEDDLEDIQRRREEVSGRYVARVGYLRAKLKSAELHEKLARR